MYTPEIWLHPMSVESGRPRLFFFALEAAVEFTGKSLQIRRQPPHYSTTRDRMGLVNKALVLVLSHDLAGSDLGLLRAYDLRNF
jgi:hypothetical protein